MDSRVQKIPWSITLNTLYDGRQPASEWDSAGEAYRGLTYLPKGLYGELIHQTLYDVPIRPELKKKKHNRHNSPESLWFHQNDQGSTVALTDDRGHTVNKYSYTSFGQVTTYGDHHRKYTGGKDSGNRLEKQLNNFINPYLFLGKPTDLQTGLVQLDARTYDPKKGRFIQGDQYNFASLALPTSAWSTLLNYTGLSTGRLLLDP